MQSGVRSLARTAALHGTPRVRPAAIPSWTWSSTVPSSSRIAWAPLHRSFATSLSSRDAQGATRVPVNAERGTPIGKVVDRRLRIVFTCTAPKSQDASDSPACGHRSSHEFSRSSYEKGVVIVQCPECSNRHLIADHLHWFSQTPSPAHPKGQTIGSEQPRTIEDLMREKGERVEWRTGATAENPEGVPVDNAADAAPEQESIKLVVRERTEEDGGKTVEVVPESEVAPSSSSSSS